MLIPLRVIFRCPCWSILTNTFYMDRSFYSTSVNYHLKKKKMVVICLVGSQFWWCEREEGPSRIMAVLSNPHNINPAKKLLNVNITFLWFKKLQTFSQNWAFAFQATLRSYLLPTNWLYTTTPLILNRVFRW